MIERLALFPLGTVLLPGLLLPLEIFEERYRALVRDLVNTPRDAPRRFGVVAIRSGREVGPEALGGIYDIGCAADLRRVESHADGRFSIVTAGGARFRLHGVDRDSEPYLVGEVEYLDDPIGEPATAAALVPAVKRLLVAYVDRLAAARAMEITLPDLPDDPRLLSYLVAASMVAETWERQGLLAAPDAVARLRTERALLRRELALLERITAVVSTELTRVEPSPN
jgi:uncharacterized protein